MNRPFRLAQSIPIAEKCRQQIVPIKALALVAGLMIVSPVSLAMMRALASAIPVVVTQKGRAFKPGELVIKAGDTVEIVNDDGELIHHAYVASPSFSFDSGDQEPGSKTDVIFSVAGKFTVLCGIHPKMHLNVEVK